MIENLRPNWEDHNLLNTGKTEAAPIVEVIATTEVTTEPESVKVVPELEADTEVIKDDEYIETQETQEVKEMEGV